MPSSPTSPSPSLLPPALPSLPPAEPGGELWSSILDSVSASRQKGSVPSRKLILLGDRNTGKSTLVSHLSASTYPALPTNNLAPSAPVPQLVPVEPDGSDVPLGLGYSTLDVGDDGDDDTLVRLSIHQIPSSSSPYSSLLPLILNPDSLKETLILVLVPFTHPNSLLTSLVRWLVLIRSVINSIKETISAPGSGQQTDRGEYVVEEAKEALEAQYRSYSEPTVGNQIPSGSNAEALLEPNSNIHLDLPLPPGTLTENMGVGIVVVCTKSDRIDQLEKEKDFKEEQFDFIQQVLRSICLRFGGALFFTSQKKPETMMRLRSYALHRLFGQLVTTSNSGASTTTNARLFSFPHKANVVDRDEVLIPMGWDSWGKIKILRDGFDPGVVGNGWLLDVERLSKRSVDKVDPHQATDAREDDEAVWDNDGRKIVSACKLWEDMIGEPDDDVPSLSFQDRVVATQEQQFLKSKYELIKKERDLDPRSHFQLSGKGHSSQHMAKFANGTLSTDKNGLPVAGAPSSLSAEEEMNSRLAQLSMREHAPNGRSGGIPLAPLELLHLQQSQSQQAGPPQTPNSARSHYLAHSSTPKSASSHINLASSAISSSSTADGASNHKEVLASFFGKLLVREPGVPRGISGMSSAMNHQPSQQQVYDDSRSNSNAGNRRESSSHENEY